MEPLPTPPVYGLRELSGAILTIGEGSTVNDVAMTAVRTPESIAESELLQTPGIQEETPEVPKSLVRQKVLTLVEAAEVLDEFQPQVRLTRLSPEEVKASPRKLSPLLLLAESLKKERAKPIVTGIKAFKIPKILKVEKPVDTQNETYISQMPVRKEESSRSRKVCFKCRQGGHHYRQCPDPTGRDFCYRCGKWDVTLAFCPNCKGKWNLEGPFVPTLHHNVPHDVHLKPTMSLSRSQIKRRRRLLKEQTRREQEVKRATPASLRVRPRDFKAHITPRQAKLTPAAPHQRASQGHQPESRPLRAQYHETEQFMEPVHLALPIQNHEVYQVLPPQPQTDEVQYYRWTMYMAQRFSQEAEWLRANWMSPSNH